MRRSLRTLMGRLVLYLPNKPYLYIFYWKHTGKRLQLKNPQLFSHKIMWLKLHGHLERFAPYADKYTVREYVERAIGKKYLIPLIGVWDKFDDIPFDELPEQFVLKVSNGCGYNFICKDKSKIDHKKAKTTIEGWQHENFYLQEREMQYKPSKARIICERYLEDDSGGLRDYKIHCTKGVPQYVQVDVDRFVNHQSEVRDLKWRKTYHQAFGDFGGISKAVKRPKNFKQMLELAAKLAAPFPYVRVDLYTLGDKIYFGELTFTPGSGIVEQQPIEGELDFGRMIDLDAYAAPLEI